MESRLIPLDEAARQAGKGKRTLERWVAQGLLTPHKVRGDRRTQVDPVELLRVLAGRARHTRAV
jgi:hypothetical protein